MRRWMWAAAAVLLLWVLFKDARAEARVPRCGLVCQSEKQHQAEAEAQREQQRQLDMKRQSENTDRQLREQRANNGPLPWSWTPTPSQRLLDLERRVDQLEANQ